MRLLFVCVVASHLILVLGCDSGEVIERTPVGSVIDANPVPGGFGTDDVTRVETTGGVFVVSGMRSVLKGVPAELSRTRDHTYLKVGGSTMRLYGR